MPFFVCTNNEYISLSLPIVSFCCFVFLVFSKISFIGADYCYMSNTHHILGRISFGSSFHLLIHFIYILFYLYFIYDQVHVFELSSIENYCSSISYQIIHPVLMCSLFSPGSPRDYWTDGLQFVVQSETGGLKRNLPRKIPICVENCLVDIISIFN